MLETTHHLPHFLSASELKLQQRGDIGTTSEAYARAAFEVREREREKDKDTNIYTEKYKERVGPETTGCTGKIIFPDSYISLALKPNEEETRGASSASSSLKVRVSGCNAWLQSDHFARWLSFDRCLRGLASVGTLGSGNVSTYRQRHTCDSFDTVVDSTPMGARIRHPWRSRSRPAEADPPPRRACDELRAPESAPARPGPRLRLRDREPVSRGRL